MFGDKIPFLMKYRKEQLREDFIHGSAWDLQQGGPEVGAQGAGAALARGDSEINAAALWRNTYNRRA